MHFLMQLIEKTIMKMCKQPLKYNNEDLDELMFKPLRIYVGSVHSDEIKDIIEGKIIRCGLAANPPHLPADFDFRLDNGSIRKFNFFEVKKFEDR